MIDYQKLYIDLSNHITEAISILKKAQEQAFEDFVNSNPSNIDVIDVVEKLKFPRSSVYKHK